MTLRFFGGLDSRGFTSHQTHIVEYIEYSTEEGGSPGGRPASWREEKQADPRAPDTTLRSQNRGVIQPTPRAQPHPFRARIRETRIIREPDLVELS